jgi:hypothetical protein
LSRLLLRLKDIFILPVLSRLEVILPPHQLPSTSSASLFSSFPSSVADAGNPNFLRPALTPQEIPPVRRRAQFILKLHSIITSPNADIIQWSSEGRTFTIKQPDLFQKKLLPKICSHNTFASFERQMHSYSFERMGEHETQPSRKRFKKGSAVKYRHPMFYQDSTQESLMNIVRRTTPTQQRKVLAKELKMTRFEASQHTLQYIRMQHVYQALQDEIEVRRSAAKAVS